MLACDGESCTGCMACASACNKNAISPVEDEHGFTHPYVDKSLCVSCGKCAKVCPVNVQHKYKQTDEIYACWQLDGKKRFEATSGGTFMTIAEKFITDGGVVYGAAFDDAFEVKHIRVDNINDLIRLRGSKYVQSTTSGIFESVKADLQNDIRVLFSGTPCQVSALKNYLGKDFEGLYTIDIVCHGVPSPRVFKDYLTVIKNKYEEGIASISFRYKKPCWSVFSMRIQFTDGQKYIANKFKDPFLYFFLAEGGDLTLRKSCFQCRFTSPERDGDITLGDFWGITAERYSQRGIEKGVGLMLVNSKKGSELFNNISNQLYVEKRDWSDAHRSNKSFSAPWKQPEKFNQFWDYYNKNGFERSANKFCDPVVAKAEMRLRFNGALRRSHAYFLPYPIRKLLKTIKVKIKRMSS